MVSSSFSISSAQLDWLPCLRHARDSKKTCSDNLDANSAEKRRTNIIVASINLFSCSWLAHSIFPKKVDCIWIWGCWFLIINVVFFSSQSREGTIELVVFKCNRTFTKQSITLSQISSSAMCLVILMYHNNTWPGKISVSKGSGPHSIKLRVRYMLVNSSTMLSSLPP